MPESGVFIQLGAGLGGVLLALGVVYTPTFARLMRGQVLTITARDYASHGLPWFELYDEQLGALTATSTLSRVKSVKDVDAEVA